MIKAIKNLKKASPSKIFPLTILFLDDLKKQKKLDIVDNLINDILEDLKIKMDNNLFFSLECIAYRYPKKIIKHKDMLEEVLLKHLKKIFKNNPNAQLSQLIRACSNLDIYKKYIHHSNDLSILSEYRDEEGLFNSLKWNNFICKIFKDCDTLIDILKKVSQGYTPWIYIKNYDQIRGITKVRRQIFITILKMVKDNFLKISKSNIDFKCIKKNKKFEQ